MVKYLIIFVLDVLLFLFSPVDMDKQYMSLVLFIVALTLLLFFSDKSIVSYNLRGNYLRHSVFFIICFVIVFFQCDLDYVLGIIDDTNIQLWYDTTVVCKSLTISNLALISLIIGYCLNKKKVHFLGANNLSQALLKIDCGNKRLCGHLIALLLLIYLIIVPQEYIANGYGSIVSDANLIIGYLQGVFIAIYVLYSLDFKQKNKSKWFSHFSYPILLSCAYIIIIVMSGRRTEALRIATLLIVSYLYCKNTKANYKYLLIFSILGVAIFSISGVLRSNEAEGINGSINQLSNVQSISPFTRELAGSVRTLHVATSICPDQVDYSYGKTFFPHFFKIIPGLSFLFTIIFGNDVLINTSDIITNAFFSGKPVYGLGSSVVADVYLAFGVLGVIVIFCIFGYFLKYLENRTFCLSNSMYSIALSFSCFSSFLYVCRSNFSIMFLCWVYACIFLYIFVRRTKTIIS